MRPIIACILVLAGTAAAVQPAPVPAPPATPPSALPVLYPLIEVVGGNDGVIWVAFAAGEYSFVEHEHTWTKRGPHSRTRAAPALAQPRTFSLVGPGRPCVVTTSDSLYLEAAWSGRHRVFEVARSVCDGDYAIAVAGIDGDARAHRPSPNIYAHTQRATTAWVERTLGGRLPDNGHSGPAAFLERLPGTDVDVIVALLAVPSPRKVQFEVLVRRKDRLLARLPDILFKGHLLWGGRDHVIVYGAGSTRAHAIGR
jgi:hypothetical protein